MEQIIFGQLNFTHLGLVFLDLFWIVGEFSKLTFVFKGFCFGGLAAAWKPSLIAQLKRDVLWDHFLLHRRSQDWKSTFVFQLQEWINQRKKKGREEQAGFLAVTRNLLNNNCWSPHNFCNQDFFFYVGGCLLLLLLCNLIWHSVLRTMRFWWTYRKRKKCHKAWKSVCDTKCQRKWYIRGEGQQTENLQSPNGVF